VSDRRVVITGTGLITALGTGAEKCWPQLLAGKSGIGRITAFTAPEIDAQIAGEVKDFNPEDFVDRREARRMDRFTQFALAAAHMAVKESGTYVDATFGRGGHSRAILARLGPAGRLVALDRDPDAVAAAAGIDDPRFSIRHARFGELGRVLAGDRSVARIFSGARQPGHQVFSWDGHKSRGIVRDGPYTVSVDATTDLGTRTETQEFAADSTPPRVVVESVTPKRHSRMR
jgi:hypothetical protein